jgi:hypothetical protein
MNNQETKTTDNIKLLRLVEARTMTNNQKTINLLSTKSGLPKHGTRWARA